MTRIQHSTDGAGPEDRERAPARRVHRVCPACGRDNRDLACLAYSRDDWEIKRCASCAFVYLENPVDLSNLRDAFAWEKTYARESERRRRERSRARDAISRFFKWIKYRIRPGHHVKVRRVIDRWVPAGRLLDVGCGQGGTIDGLDARFIPFGVEISPVLAARARAKAEPRGGRVVVSDALHGVAEFDDAYFSGVVMRAYLEHEHDPAPVLAQAFRVLEPGGVAVIKVPNFGSLNRRIVGKTWCGFRFPDHVNYFTPRALRAMVEGAGFRVLALASWPLSDNMWLVARKSER